MSLHTERRRTPRYNAPKGTLLAFLSPSHEDRNGDGVLLDASKDGCGIASEVPLTVNHYYRLIIQAISGHSVMIETARVCWSQAPAYGLKFVTVDQDQEEFFQQYLFELRSLGI
jgi:hypothetical protein